jgi:hypothetical protein
MTSDLTLEIAAVAARLVVDEGMEYGPAKRRAADSLGLRTGGRRGGAELPDNELLEDAVREHLALFCADTQPAELLALRELAVQWMARWPEFRPHLCGAVWRGTATRLSTLHIELYCEDSKAAEIALLDAGVDFDVASAPGPRGQPIDTLLCELPCRALQTHVLVRLSVLDHDDLRGALKPDARGRSQRGDLAALRRLLDTQDAQDTSAPPPAAHAPDPSHVHDPLDGSDPAGSHA